MPGQEVSMLARKGIAYACPRMYFWLSGEFPPKGDDQMRRPAALYARVGSPA